MTSEAGKPLVFNGPMVRALLAGTKTQTRRVFSHQWTVLGSRWGKNAPWAGLDLEKATVGTRSGLGFPDAHLRVPWVHPDDAARGMRWEDDCCIYRVRPPYEIGDHIWVREAWQLHSRASDFGTVVYRASINNSWTEAHEMVPVECLGKLDGRPLQTGWRSSARMPRSCSRLTLIVTDVRVQRLHDISEEDALAEGCKVVREHCNVFEGTGYDRSGLCHSSPVTAFGCFWDTLHGADSWNENPWVAALTFTAHRCNIDAMPAEPAKVPA